MNPEATLFDDFIDFENSDVGAVILFEGGPSSQSTVVDCEDNRVQQLLVTPIEGHVDEDALVVRGHRPYAQSGLCRGF